MCEPAGSEDLVYHSKLSPLEQSLTITMYYVSENLFYLYVCVNVYIYQFVNHVMRSFLHFVARESLWFFLPFCECFEYQMSYQEINDIFYLSTKSSTCFVKMLRM